MNIPKFSHFLLTGCLGILLLNSCDSNRQEQQEVVADKVQAEVRFGNEIMKVKPLSKRANDLAISWGAYEDFDAAILEINGSTVSDLKNTTERLIVITDSLAVKIPDSLDTQPIRSRLVVVSTEVKLLQQEANKPGSDSSKVAARINTFNEAVSDFYFHIDEKLQKDAIDIQRIEDEKKELEKQKKFLDSVYQAELNDQNQQ